MNMLRRLKYGLWTCIVISMDGPHRGHAPWCMDVGNWNYMGHGSFLLSLIIHSFRFTIRALPSASRVSHSLSRLPPPSSSERTAASRAHTSHTAHTVTDTHSQEPRGSRSRSEMDIAPHCPNAPSAQRPRHHAARPPFRAPIPNAALRLPQCSARGGVVMPPVRLLS